MNGEFIDTNIFVYLFDETDDRKRITAERLVRTALETRGAHISYQSCSGNLERRNPQAAIPDDGGAGKAVSGASPGAIMANHA